MTKRKINKELYNYAIESLLQEWPLLIGLTTSIILYFYHSKLLTHLSNPFYLAFVVIWLFGVGAVVCFAILRNAECIALHLKEPLGTVVLTVAVTCVEAIMITALMYINPNESTLARDTMYSAIMIMLNGVCGISLILGGIRYREQYYNLRGVNAFLSVIIPLIVLMLILPNFTRTIIAPTFGIHKTIWMCILSFSLYGVFLAIQNHRHRTYFIDSKAVKHEKDAIHGKYKQYSIMAHIILLIIYLIPMAVVAESLSKPIDHIIRILNAPSELGGMFVALLMLSPESAAAIKAALENKLQKSVNIIFGSILSSIALTVPLVLVIGRILGRKVMLGLEPAEMIMLSLTLVVSLITFSTSKTNVLLGASQLLLFLVYCLLLMYP